MVRIRCTNKDCESPTRTFDWDDETHLGPGVHIVVPYEPGGIRKPVICPFCGTENYIWVTTGREKPHLIVRE